jgi:hypothetical protein
VNQNLANEQVRESALAHQQVQWASRPSSSPFGWTRHCQVNTAIAAVSVAIAFTDTLFAHSHRFSFLNWRAMTVSVL